jgi:N-acetyl-beta-hexosaminidase
MFEHKVSTDFSTSLTVNVEDPQAVLKLDADESYTLSVADSKIQIDSKTQFGYYHALQTLSQLVEFNFDTESYR